MSRARLTLEAACRDLEQLYGAALGLGALLETLEPGDRLSESIWFLTHQLVRQLIDRADDARASLVTLRDDAP